MKMIPGVVISATLPRVVVTASIERDQTLERTGTHVMQGPHHPGGNEGVLQSGEKQDGHLDLLDSEFIGKLILEEEIGEHLKEAEVEDDFSDGGNVSEGVFHHAIPDQRTITRVGRQEQRHSPAQ